MLGTWSRFSRQVQRGGSRERISRVAGDHRDADTKPMKFSDGFTGFGPNLVFHHESSEYSRISSRMQQNATSRASSEPCKADGFSKL